MTAIPIIMAWGIIYITLIYFKSRTKWSRTVKESWSMLQPWLAYWGNILGHDDGYDTSSEILLFEGPKALLNLPQSRFAGQASVGIRNMHQLRNFSHICFCLAFQGGYDGSTC